jgi:AGZA family xanthine/uracil permease-like MFS transporter
MLIGVLATTGVGALAGLVEWQPRTFAPGDIAATALQLDVRGALQLGAIEIVFVFLFVDLFDNVGTLVAVGKKARLFDEAHQVPRLNRILLSDAAATITGSLLGTSTVVSYIESAAGVVAGGRSGVTSIVAGLLFFGALFVAPMVGAIPAAATAPALILVGSMMASHIAEIDWDDMVLAIPAFLTIIAIPLTFSIANGIAFGFTMFTALCVLRRDFNRVNWLMYVLTALFIVRFAYLGGA